MEAVDEELPKEVPKEAKVEKVKVSGKEARPNREVPGNCKREIFLRMDGPEPST